MTRSLGTRELPRSCQRAVQPAARFELVDRSCRSTHCQDAPNGSPAAKRFAARSHARATRRRHRRSRLDLIRSTCSSSRTRIAYRTWRGVRMAARPPLAWGWTAAVGLFGGVVSGFFGVGGAFVAPPLLTAFFGVRQVEAQGLALALVSPSVVVALFTYAAAGQVEWFVGIPLALGGTAAISAGVALARRLPERRLRLGFCGLLLITAMLLAVRG